MHIGVSQKFSVMSVKSCELLGSYLNLVSILKPVDDSSIFVIMHLNIKPIRYMFVSFDSLLYVNCVYIATDYPDVAYRMDKKEEVTLEEINSCKKARGKVDFLLSIIKSIDF